MTGHLEIVGKLLSIYHSRFCNMSIYYICLSTFSPINGGWSGGLYTSHLGHSFALYMCSDLLMSMFVNRMQELLLPEEVAAAYVVIGLCESHKWHLEFTGACKCPQVCDQYLATLMKDLTLVSNYKCTA